jgi:hypothetical protein
MAVSLDHHEHPAAAHYIAEVHGGERIAACALHFQHD